jgi:hypothetical protein
MKDFRHAIDVTPWDKSGNSFWGLDRKQAKFLGWIFIGLGLLLMNPPSGSPDDLLNFAFAKYMSVHFPILSNAMWLLFSYTVLAVGFIVLGCYIYPFNTSSLLSGYMNKGKAVIRKIVSNPLYLVGTVIIIYVAFRFFSNINV